MDNPIQRSWVEHRSKLHELGHRFNSRYAQQKLTGVTPDPEEILKYLYAVYDKTAAMAVKTVIDHESAITLGQKLDEYWKPFLKRSLVLVRSRLGPDRGTESKQLVARLRCQLLPRSEHWKAKAHRRALLQARSTPREASLTRKAKKGDPSLIEGKPYVSIPIAARYVGVSIRRIQQAIRDHKLTSKGSKGNRVILVDSLQRYQPPIHEKK